MNALTIWQIVFALFIVNLFNVLVFIFSTVKKSNKLTASTMCKIHKLFLLDKCVIILGCVTVLQIMSAAVHADLALTHCLPHILPFMVLADVFQQRNTDISLYSQCFPSSLLKLFCQNAVSKST